MNENEELRKALEEAKRENHKRSDFLSRMSHEIRTPLNAIIGLSYLSKENEAMPDKVYENLDKIEQSAHFLLSFVNDILSLSDLESGRIALDYDSIEIRKYFKTLLLELRTKAEEKQIYFSSVIPQNMEGVYVFDEKLLSKAFRYLIDNAVKTTPSGGTISFVSDILTESEEEMRLLVTISDNGLGIDETLLPKVFEPFEQLYGDSRTLYSGSGLELAITKNIVELMNGEISVTSKKGIGTTFSIVLSLKKERRSKKRPKEQEGKMQSFDFTGKRALIVEDSDINIEIAKNILLHKHFDVEVALNGEEAVTTVSGHEAGYYDVILMDIRMPVMDGLEATKRIRQMEERPDGRLIPIIAMTANAFEEDVKKSLEAGMNGHLSKPIDIQKMYALLDHLLNEEE